MYCENCHKKDILFEKMLYIAFEQGAVWHQDYLTKCPLWYEDSQRAFKVAQEKYKNGDLGVRAVTFKKGM